MSNIARAIEEMQTERANLAARLAKVDALIVTMREMFHLPPNGHKAAPRKVKAPVPPPVALKPAANSQQDGRVSDDLVRVALQNGPLSPGVLGVRLNVERVRLRRHLEQMEARGLVTITGNTTTKQISLPGVPAKEAP
jgi:hypothetical protein